MKTIYKKLLFLFLLLPISVLAQSGLSGSVVDSKSNQPLPGVNVTVQGANQSTSTDFDGKFQLNKLKDGDKIVFSFVGYDSSTVVYAGQKTVSVSLNEAANQLQEVVVQVGYGSVKKKDATGSVATLSAKDFNKGSNVTAENMLSGRVAGVTINTSGAPGSGSEIRIRGGASLNASNDPLIVIDGLPILNVENKASTSVLAALNPNDIESFTVLKDASATAIYGSRASNGVIIITTKRGGKKLSVEYNFQYGSGKNVNQIDVFGADEYRALVQQERPGLAGLLGTANTDWQKEIYRRTDYVDNNVSIKGNLFNTIPARLSFGNTYQEGLRLTNSFTRNTLSTTLNPAFFDNHLKLRLNATYANESNRFADGVEGSAFRFDPTQPVYQAGSPFGGYFEYYSANGNLILGTRNPVAQLMQTNDTGTNRRIFGNFEVDYKFHFFPALRAVVNVGFDESNGDRRRVVGAGVATGNNYTDAGIVHYIGTDSKQTALLRNKLLDAYFVYNKTFGKTALEATAGYSYQIFNEERTYFGDLRRGPLQPANPTVYRPEIDNVLIGLFGRANVTYNDKYLFTASFRRDASSRVAKENRWHNYPAFAFAWKMKNDFFKDSKTISDMKLRVGYGITGQQSLPSQYNNIYLQQYSVGTTQSQYNIGGLAIPIAISKPYNNIINWEETTTYNAGLDYGLFSNRISGGLDIFYKKTDHLFSVAPVADGGNYSNSLLQNIGSFSTKGIELTVNAEVVKSTDFNWNTNFNITKYERRIDALAGGADVLFGGTGAGTGGTALIYREGYTPGSFYVYKQLYDLAGAPVEGAYADLNGDGLINGDDRYIYKNPDPDFVFGFASNMYYKNLDFSFNLRASLGNRVYNAVNAGNAQYDNLQSSAVLGNIPTSVLDTNFNTTSDVVLSDRYVENGSFLRVDNITLGYTFPKWLEGKASLRFFTGIQNAFILTKYSGLDPEITGGIDNTIYPRQRQFLFGANVKF